jgi:hypothetical protein
MPTPNEKIQKIAVKLLPFFKPAHYPDRPAWQKETPVH